MPLSNQEIETYQRDGLVIPSDYRVAPKTLARINELYHELLENNRDNPDLSPDFILDMPRATSGPLFYVKRLTIRIPNDSNLIGAQYFQQSPVDDELPEIRPPGKRIEAPVAALAEISIADTGISNKGIPQTAGCPIAKEAGQVDEPF